MMADRWWERNLQAAGMQVARRSGQLVSRTIIEYWCRLKYQGAKAYWISFKIVFNESHHSITPREAVEKRVSEILCI